MPGQLDLPRNGGFSIAVGDRRGSFETKQHDAEVVLLSEHCEQ